MKRKAIIPVAFIALGIIGGSYWWFTRSHQPDTGRLEMYGNVDIRQVQLAFNGTDRIDRILVQEGDAVKKGQVLAMLDTDRLTQNVEYNQGQVSAQQQVLARLKAGSRPEEIRKAQADVEVANVEARNAERTYQRIQQLVSRQFVAKQQADDAKAALEGAQAKLKAAQEAYRLIVLGPRKEDIAAAGATLQASQAALALARKQLADATLHAPSDGIIQDRILEPGDMASPQQPVFTLALEGPIWVRAYVPGPDLGKLKPGMNAEVSTDSFPGKHYRAWVGYISPSAEFTPKSVETAEVRSSLVYQVRVFVCNPQNELRLGMPATVSILLNQAIAADTGAGRCK